MCSPPAVAPTQEHSNPEDIERRNEYLRSLKHLDASKLPFTPIPDGDATCNITAIRAGVLYLYSRDFLALPPEKEEVLHATTFVFLIEKTLHNGDTKRLIFDLGLRYVSHSPNHR